MIQLQQITIRPYDPAKDTSRFRPTGNDWSLPQSRIFLSVSEGKWPSAVLPLIRPIRQLHFGSAPFTRGLQSSYIKNIPWTPAEKYFQSDYWCATMVADSSGSRCYLTKYIKQEPFIYSDSVYSVHRKIKTDARVKRNSGNNLGCCSKKMRVFMCSNTFITNPMETKNMLILGHVYVLTGGFRFCNKPCFVKYQRTTKCNTGGEETGGGYYGNNGVFIPELVLPHTKLAGAVTHVPDCK